MWGCRRSCSLTGCNSCWISFNRALASTMASPSDRKEKITARRAAEAANQMSGAFEIASYNCVLLAGEKPELLPPNLPFLQSLHVGMPKKLFVDRLQFLLDLL